MLPHNYPLCSSASSSPERRPRRRPFLERKEKEASVVPAAHLCIGSVPSQKECDPCTADLSLTYRARRILTRPSSLVPDWKRENACWSCDPSRVASRFLCPSFHQFALLVLPGIVRQLHGIRAKRSPRQRCSLPWPGRHRWPYVGPSTPSGILPARSYACHQPLLALSD